jgi:hypothetical protein
MQYRVGAEYAASNTYSLALLSTWIQPLGFTPSLNKFDTREFAEEFREFLGKGTKARRRARISSIYKWFNSKLESNTRQPDIAHQSCS